MRPPVWSGPWALSALRGQKGAASVFAKAPGVPQVPPGCRRGTGSPAGFAAPRGVPATSRSTGAETPGLNWHLHSDTKLRETPRAPTALCRHTGSHLNRRIFFFLVLILQKTSLVSITIYSTGILGLFFVPLHLIIFSRVQTFYDMQILTRTRLLFIQSAIMNKPTTAAYNVEEFYSYRNPVPSSTANITIIFKMSLNIILFHLEHRNPGVKRLHFS